MSYRFKLTPRSQSRGPLSCLFAVAAGLSLFALAEPASARCRTKPAVCARLAASQAAAVSRAVAATRAVVEPLSDPSTGAARAGVAKARCTSKPSVCARLQQQQRLRPTPSVAPWPTKLASEGSTCRSKPAVCMRLRQLEPQPTLIASQ